MIVYRRVPTSKTEPCPKEVGPVLHFPWAPTKAVEFLCPCGERVVHVTQPPFTVSFHGDDDRLTLDGSCGYRPDPELGRPENWCHFQVVNGEVSFYADAQCPGAHMTGHR